MDGEADDADVGEDDDADVGEDGDADVNEYDDTDVDEDDDADVVAVAGNKARLLQLLPRSLPSLHHYDFW